MEFMYLYQDRINLCNLLLMMSPSELEVYKLMLLDINAANVSTTYFIELAQYIMSKRRAV